MSAQGKYIFLAANKASKTEVKKIIEAIYKVHVVDTNVINTRPKPRRVGQNMSMKSGYKKVIVTLKKGEKLDILPH